MASPGGEAVERSETDEDRRNVSTVNAVRKNGTIFEDWTFLFVCAPCGKLSPFLIRPLRGHLPPRGKALAPPNYNLSIYATIFIQSGGIAYV